MKICHYSNGDAVGKVGVVDADQVFPIGDALIKAGMLRQGYSMLEVLEALSGNPKAMDVARKFKSAGEPAPLKSVRLLAPITNSPALWCAASNYKAHQEEMKGRVGASYSAEMSKDDLMAEFFLKPASSVIGPNGTVMLPKVQIHTDFECELAAIIGKPARKVSEDQALDHVFGYLMCWDFSLRDPWGKNRQNTRNIRKGCDTFAGLGPWIVTADEIDDPQDIGFQVEHNGKTVMTAHTSDMICTLREHIRFLSSLLTLATGAIITTGTPAGVSQLARGDKLKGTMEKIGVMEFSVEAEG